MDKRKGSLILVVSGFKPQRHSGTKEHSVILVKTSTMNLRVSLSLWFKNLEPDTTLLLSC
jgi:hypothetical protein